MWPYALHFFSLVNSENHACFANRVLLRGIRSWQGLSPVSLFRQYMYISSSYSFSPSFSPDFLSRSQFSPQTTQLFQTPSCSLANSFTLKQTAQPGRFVVLVGCHWTLSKPQKPVSRQGLMGYTARLHVIYHTCACLEQARHSFFLFSHPVISTPFLCSVRGF